MPHTTDGFCPIEDAIAELKAGRMIVLVDDENRENEGDLVIAAEKVTPQAINFMITHARGLVCLAMSHATCQRLHLEPLPGHNVDPAATPFTPYIDARTGITTGTSAFDRARTVQVAIDDRSGPDDLIRGKGHVPGLRAKAGGVLVRAGHTEGSVDLARLAGLKEAAVICEILTPEGHMARVPELREFCKQHGFKMCTIEDLIKYRRQREKLVRREVHLKLPTEHGEFDLFVYSSVVDPEPHLALTKGGVGVPTSPSPPLLEGGEELVAASEELGVVPEQTEPVLVRIHSQCLTGDIFGSLRCDCGPQLRHAMEQVNKAGKGVILYMRQEGRGIGLLNKLKAYKLQIEQGLDTVEANKQLGYAPDLRHYGIGAQILFDLGVRQIRLLTNNPKKVVGLDGYGLRIVERVPIQVEHSEHNLDYLRAKRDKLGHLLHGMD
jgi:3,4-dihydroxy 2-butanone 4-phosphate synthase/GTP cyclohydrolase II